MGKKKGGGEENKSTYRGDKSSFTVRKIEEKEEREKPDWSGQLTANQESEDEEEQLRQK